MSKRSETDVRRRFLDLLAGIKFSDRYYKLCDEHAKLGTIPPLEIQREIVAATGRAARYHKGEKFFGFDDPDPPDSAKLGINISFGDGMVELVFRFRAGANELGGPFSVLASNERRLRQPNYKHDPPFPCPGYLTELEARTIVEAAFSIYDDIKQAILEVAWQ